MDYENVLGESRFPNYDQLKDGLLRLIDEGRITREDAARLLPELRESEDERIRRTLVEYFGPEVQIDLVRGIPIQKIRDWLEKQKELTPADGWDYADKRMSHPLYWEGFEAGRAVERELSEYEKQKEQKPNIELIQRSWYMEGYHDREFGKEPKWIVKTDEGGPRYEENPKYGQMLAEQKPAEWSEDYREEDIQTRFAFYTYKDDPSVLYLSNVFVEETSRNHGFGTRILKAAEKVAEAIGAITICLKVKQNSPANAWYRKRGYGYVAFEDGYDWLEKNLEYLKPAKSAEWSEKDERMLDSVIRIITQFDDLAYEQSYSWPIGTHPYIKELAWLKSLRPSWKPSEEQMNALVSARFLYRDRLENSAIASALESLCIELNKLRYGSTK